MRAAGLVILVHVLTWGAIGAALSPRAGLPRWAGACISVVVPILGPMILLTMWLRKDAPGAHQTRAGGARAALVAVVGGLVIAVAAWLPWASLEVAGEAPGVREQALGMSSQDWDWLAVTGTMLGVLIAATAALAMRRGNQLWVIPTASVAWLPAAFAGSLILAAGPLGGVLEHAEDAGHLVHDVTAVDVDVTAEYAVGPGAYSALLGALIALSWAFVWAVGSWTRTPEPVGGASPRFPTAPSTQTRGQTDWGTNEMTSDPDWDT